MWGDFKEVLSPDPRAYVRAYWRFLLGWGQRPRQLADKRLSRQMRELARDEVIAYRKAAAHGARIFYPFPKPPEPPSPTPPARARRAS